MTMTTMTTTSVDDGRGRGPPPLCGRARNRHRRRILRQHHRLAASTCIDADFDVGRCRDEEDDRSSGGRNAPFVVGDDDDDVVVGGGDDDGRSVGAAGRGKNATVASSSVAKKRRKAKKNDDEPCYWHDEDDPFFVVTDENLVYDGRGGMCELRAGEKPPQQQQREKNHNDTDATIEKMIDGLARCIIDRDDGKRIKFTIRGNPRVLVRHRTARGFVYNPSRAMQESFRDALLGLLPSRFRPTVTDDDDDEDDDDDDEDEDDDEDDDVGTIRGGRRGGGGGSSSPPIVPAVLFSEGESLRLSIIFRMKRPASHFVAGRRTGPSSRLKPAFSSAGGRPMPAAAIRSDVDNLAKFVMDSLNGVLYVDDRQVVNLNVMKVLDSEGPCFGATEVEICVLREGDMMV